ncbi:hypothetical protein L209DRAFT_581831 [Thermothelomyces heterothallicus CBS 203.75]
MTGKRASCYLGFMFLYLLGWTGWDSCFISHDNLPSWGILFSFWGTIRRTSAEAGTCHFFFPFFFFGFSSPPSSSPWKEQLFKERVTKQNAGTPTC